MLTLHDFQVGVIRWGDRSWPTDFHNAFYGRLAAENPDGAFTADWWRGFMPHLRAWLALRPVGGDVLTRKVEAALPQLRTAWAVACAPHVGRDITVVTWADVAPFADLVGQLKPRRDGEGHVLSPVFRAKFCHFLAPALFPVVDNAAMGLPFGRSYGAHFLGVQQEWAQTPVPVQEQLKYEMVSRVDAPLTDQYPVVNKIVELCLLGRPHISGRRRAGGVTT